MAEHTPGPWEKHFTGADPAKRRVSYIGPLDRHTGLVAHIYEKDTTGEAEANARLIAAAPDTAAERDRLRDVLGAILVHPHIKHRLSGIFYEARLLLDPNLSGLPSSERDRLKAVNAELMAALEAVVRAIDDYVSDDEGKGAMEFDGQLPQARAAIAKARGEQ